MRTSKSNVRSFPAGTAEYVVMHARWRLNRGARPSLTFLGIRNPVRALEYARRVAYFPVSGVYLNGEVPEGYVCGECGVRGVRLWRMYQTCVSQQSLLCLACACREQKEVRTPAEDGMLYTDEVYHLYRTADMPPGHWNGYDPAKGPPRNAVVTRTEREKTDQIGFRVPAVPTEEGDTYWGYSSIPAPGVRWWHELPFSLTEEAK